MTPGTRRFPILLVLPYVLVSYACTDGSRAETLAGEPPGSDGRLFTLLPSSYSGVEFKNRVEETRDDNVFTYRNYYNGGGAAIGDLNGDGLPEVMLTANLNDHGLYLNQGEFRFRDVTEEAGIERRGVWATGVTFADVNADGLLDIYICYAGRADAARRANELFIHQGVNDRGVPRFEEMAAEYGLADQGYGVQAAFFDYDRDGLLDVYVVNNSPRPVSSFGLRNERHVRHEFGGDRLYRNVGGRFEDVSEHAGILGPEFAFGLGVAVGDVNRDGWPDIYVSNDFFERDYLYLNNRDGTFQEGLDAAMPAISYASMGLDMADVDNDGWLDVLVTDMLPSDDRRLKTTTSFEDWDAYQINLRHDYHHQFTRNTLQRNNHNGTFSEIAHLAGVAATDWSWSALMVDFDLDGYKDIHITNGILHDVTGQDYVSYLASEETLRQAARGARVDFLSLIENMTSTPLSNHAFRNDGGVTFSDSGAAWGLDTPAFSNGAAYGDLDGDGAPDLVVNNVNAEAFVYRNNARATPGRAHLQVRLEGEGGNPWAIGSRVTLRARDRTFVQELMPSRGFQSSVDYVLTFGLGNLDTVAVTVAWPDGRVSELPDIPANQRITVRQSESSLTQPAESTRMVPLLVDVTAETSLDAMHQENAFSDFQREPLMPKLLSTEGPYMAVGDVTGDGLDDVFFGGAKDQAGQLFFQRRDGRFVRSSETPFERDRASEDLGAVFFDATGDGHLDLYVVSGGSEFSDMAPALQDRLYVNDGHGRFRKAEGHVPIMSVSGSRAVPADFDRDGDVDLFVGGRIIPWRYGLNPQSVLLQNDGHGRFRDVTADVAPALQRIGMVTDAMWADVVGDDRLDLIVVGEWMPISIFRGTSTGSLEAVAAPGLEHSHGWWNRIVAGDFTGDGRTDFVVGNWGRNMRFHASEREPATMVVGDFDRDGFVEQVISQYDQGTSYPLALREELVRALPFVAERYRTHESYAQQTVEDVLAASGLDGAVRKRVDTFATTLVRNDGDGAFTLLPLPIEAQIAPVFGILAADVDGDGALDLLIAGNFDGVQPAIGRLSASYGLFLRGDGRGGMRPVAAPYSGFFVPGEARDIRRLSTARGELYVVTRNDDRPLVFRAGPPGALARSGQ